MSEGKYIIIKRLGHEIPILFSSLIDHKEMAGGAKVVAAGFFELDFRVIVYGHSESLSTTPRPEDSELIKKMLKG